MITTSEAGALEASVAIEGNTRTREEILQEYWGDRWPEVKAKLKNKDLSKRAKGELPKWEDVAGQVCSQMRFSEPDRESWSRQYFLPSPLTLAFLVAQFDAGSLRMTDADVAILEGMLTESRAQGLETLNRVEAAINAALTRKCVAGDFIHAPFTPVELDPRPEPAIYASGFMLNGWAVKYVVSRKDLGDSANDLEELGKIQSTQRKVVLQYLREKRGH